MFGPCPLTDWKKSVAPNISGTFKHLKSGVRYRVILPFTDYDGDIHLTNECWTFLWASFSPYENGQTLAVSIDGNNEWLIRMQLTKDAQANIIDNLTHYIIND